jgi:hypothetical protein
MACQCTKVPAVPGHNSRDQLGNNDLGTSSQQTEGRSHRVSHPKPADQDPGPETGRKPPAGKFGQGVL